MKSLAFDKTPNIELEILDTSQYANTKIIDLIKVLCGTSFSNMIKLDSVINNLQKFGIGFKATITGDDSSTVFNIEHGKNNSSPHVSIFTSDGIEIFPEINIIDSNNIELVFIYPLPQGNIYQININ